MANYRLNTRVVSRAKGQNAVAKAAYNSASKIKDYQEEEYKNFQNKNCDYSLILTQDHVPKEYEDREYLWNKVHETEKRKDSQLAREIQIALPTEFTNEDNIELAKEFAESLKDEGMIVDLNIHKLESNNPHAHLLCTLRAIDENGEFEPKRKGNEFIRDWNTKEKNLEWRIRWESIQNKHLEKHGFAERVSHKSYKDQGLDLEATKTEGWLERKYYKETGNLSEKGKYNAEIRKDNQNKIKNIYKDNDKKLNKYDYVNEEQSKELSSIAKELKVYVSPKNLMEKSLYIDDLSSKSLLITDDEKRNKQEQKVSESKELIDNAKEIFSAQAKFFFQKHYNYDFDNLSDDDKIYLTNYMLDNNIILHSSEFETIINEKIEEENKSTLNNILNNKEATYENINREKEFFSHKMNIILEKNNINLDDIENVSETDFERGDYDKILYYSNRLDRLAIADNILEEYYNKRVNEIFDNDKNTINSFITITDIEEKKDIVDFIDFYGENSTLEMIDKGEYINRFNEEEREDIMFSITVHTDILNKQFSTYVDDKKLVEHSQKIKDKYDINLYNDNDVKHVIKESLYNNDKNVNEFLKTTNIKYEKYDYEYKPINFSNIHQGVNAVVFSMNEIFKERMTKYQNKEYKSKNHSKQKMDGSNQRTRSRNRGRGLT